MKNQYSILTWTTKKVQNDGRNIEIHFGVMILAGFNVRTAVSCQHLDFLVNLLKPLYLHTDWVFLSWPANSKTLRFTFHTWFTDRFSLSAHVQWYEAKQKQAHNSEFQLWDKKNYFDIIYTWQTFLYSKPWMVNGKKFVCDCPNPPTHTSHHVITQHGPGIKFAILSNYRAFSGLFTNLTSAFSFRLKPVAFSFQLSSL